MGVRVSPSPRSSPVDTPCSPSNNWNSAATTSRRRPTANTASLGREHADERPRDQNEGQGGCRHERRPNQQRRAAGERGPGGIAPPDRVSDADGAGRRDAQRHHERQAGEVQGDLVRRERDRIEPAGKRAGRREHAEFERHLGRRRQAEPQQPQQAASASVSRSR